MTRRLALLLLAASCGGDRAPAPTAGAPRATITAPAPGDSTGAEVTIALGAAGVRIAPATGTREAGVGHHHLFLDLDPSPAGVAIPSEPGVVHLGKGDSVHTFAGLAPGPHRVIAVLAWGDHVPIDGAGRDTVEFVVR